MIFDGVLFSRRSHRHGAHSACGQGGGNRPRRRPVRAASAHLAIGIRRNAADGQGGGIDPPSWCPTHWLEP